MLEHKLYAMNLQLFAEPGESTVAAEPAQTPQPTEPIESGAETVVAEPNKEDVAFSKRLAAEKAKIEQTYTPYKSILEEAAKSYGFSDVNEYIKAYESQKEQQRLESEAQKYGATPELMQELNTVKSKLESYEREKFQTEIQSKVAEVLNVAEKEGNKITEEQILKTMIDKGINDPRDAYKLLKPEPDLKTIEENAIKKYIENLKKGYKPVEGGGTAPVVVQDSPKTFEDARKRAIAMLKNKEE